MRAFVKIENKVPISRMKIYEKDKERIRPDVAELLGDIQMYAMQDKINFGQLKYGQYMWQEDTRLGRDRLHEQKWDGMKYDQFLHEFRLQQTW
jgi:hypothetical protein